MRNRMLLVGLLILSSAGCATAGASTPPSAATSSPPSAAAASPSAAAATAKTEPLDVAVKWDGSTCTYLGPTVLPDGTLTRFSFTSSEQLVLDVVGVSPGTTWDRIVADAKTHPASGGADWVIETGIANIPPNSSALYTISSRVGVHGTGVVVGTPVGGYVVGCSTAPKPQGTDVFYPAALLRVAGDEWAW